MVDKGLAIKLGILGIFLIGIAVAIFFGVKEYKKQCPDGLMVCLGLEDPISNVAGPGQITSPSSNVIPTSNTNPQSVLYTKCSGALLANETRICKNDTQVGVSWSWTQSTTSAECIKATEKWKLIISSGKDNHRKRFTYTVNSARASGIIINGPDTFLKDANIKVIVIPLDKNNKQVSSDIKIEVDDKKSDNNCSIIGTTPIDFGLFKDYDAEVKAAETNIVPSDCKGTIIPGKCMAVTDNYCGSTGTKIDTFVVSQQPAGTGKKCPSTGGSNCILQASDGCVERPVGTPKPSACKTTGGWSSVQDGPLMRKFAENAKKTSAASGKALAYDVDNIYDLTPANIGDNSSVFCSKPYTKPGELPGFYVRTKYLNDIMGSYLDNTLDCELPPGETFDMNSCNENTKPCTWEKKYGTCDDINVNYTWEKKNPSLINEKWCGDTPSPLTGKEYSVDCYNKIFGTIDCVDVDSSWNRNACDKAKTATGGQCYWDYDFESCDNRESFSSRPVVRCSDHGFTHTVDGECRK